MKFPGVETVSYPRADRAKVRSYLQWLLAGRDDSIAIAARYAASARLPSDLYHFLRTTRIGLIQANHVFSMLLAQRIAEIVRRQQGQYPHIILDTHDLQSDVYRGRHKKNWHSRRVDDYDNLLQTELALCSQAGTLIHHCQSDHDFFLSRLPGRIHELIVPTLHPESEAELIKRRGLYRPAEFDFVYLGNNHEANLKTVRWLLRDVLPRTDVGHSVRIVGTIGRLVRDRDPELFGKHEHLFLGEVPCVYDLYTAAKAVLAPAAAGTGTSIKLIEALCAGRPVLTTTLGIRGLPRGQSLGQDIHLHDSAEDFAETMNMLSKTGATDSLANAELYDSVFSNHRFFAALAAVIDRSMATSASTRLDMSQAPSSSLLVSSP
jgi:hypothetical protein